MTTGEILKQLNGLPPADRLKVIESTVHQMLADLENLKARGSDDAEGRLKRAAEALLADYSNDKELTAFTALDGEAFHG